MKKKIKWIVVNLAFAVLTYFALSGVEAIGNMIILITWLSLFAHIGCYVNAKEGKFDCVTKAPYGWVGAYNLAILLAFAACGWWWTAIAWAVGSGYEQLAMEVKEKNDEC